jgi:nucleotide-binding universal stress UspA family protein
MFKQILVPLDGSRLAEAAMQPAIWLGQHFNSALMLIHVIERNAPQEVHGDRHLTNNQDACVYLDEVAKRIPEQIRRETHVHTEETRKVAASIAEHIQELDQDLVVMCTHGDSGFKQWMVGTIAQQVIGLGRMPVLLIRPDDSSRASFPGFRRILVALDEKSEHGCGLSLAGEMAQHLELPIVLLTVVPKLDTLSGKASATGKLLPMTTAVLLDIQEEDARKSLEERAEALRKQGVQVSCEIRRGDPASRIAVTAQELGVDLIVVGTHGKVGMEAFWAGSVAPRLPGLTNIPLLLVPTCR